MKGLFLTVAILLICFSLLGALRVVASGGNLADYQYLTLNSILKYISNTKVDISLDKSLNSFEFAKSAIFDVAEWVEIMLDKTFGTNDTDWYMRIIYFFEFLITLFVQILNVVCQILNVVLSFVIDIVESVIWIFEILIYLIIPVPKTVI